MKKNEVEKDKLGKIGWSKKLKNSKGITLVALVVTIIVLLILAGVSLSMVLSQDGIFSRAEQATDKYGEAKARETLELALGEAQMKKYEEGLTDEELDNQIGKIQGELLPKEKPEKPNLQNVIVDGHIFEIDRSVPKIVNYIGPADGVVITASISGNNGWQKKGDAKVTITGTIKTYSGGTITSSSATATNGVTIPANFPTTGGNYTIEVTQDTTITITAKDSTNKENSKTIPVTIRVDDIAPTVDTIDAKVEGLVIKFSATGTDEQSGIKHFSYKITSTQDTTLEGIPEDKRKGTFLQGENVIIETTATGDREETTYTITVNAVDNCDNTSTDKTKDATAIDGLTVAQAKELVNAKTLQRYIGTRIIDYIPEAGGTWRIFYYDEEGYFGMSDTLYLRSDNGGTIDYNVARSYEASSDGVDMMKKMNPKWRDYPTTDANVINGLNEIISSYLLDTSLWTKYKADNAKFAIGSPSLEMYVMAYNVWKQNNSNGSALVCKVASEKGYSIGSNGSYYNDGEYLNNNTVNRGPHNIFIQSGYGGGLASPVTGNNGGRLYPSGYTNSLVSNDAEWIAGCSPICAI